MKHSRRRDDGEQKPLLYSSGSASSISSAVDAPMTKKSTAKDFGPSSCPNRASTASTMTVGSVDSDSFGSCIPGFRMLSSTLPRSFSLPLGMLHNVLPDPFPELSSPLSPHDNDHSMTVMLNFYNNDNSYKQLLIEEHLRAKDVCHLLAMKNHVPEEKSWAIVEHIDELGLRRTLEDHEVALDIYEQWASCDQPHLNKFYFRKDFRKFELFENPAQFFPSHMIDVAQVDTPKDESLGILETSERAKTLLLQDLVSSDTTLPLIHGLLYMKDPVKKSWRKMFFWLRSSQLYYTTKGASKDSKHAILYEDMRQCTAYYLSNPGKSQGAPTDFCFVLKPKTAWKDLKYLCADAEASRECWIASMRLIKYGKQLKENHRLAQNREAFVRNQDSSDMHFKHITNKGRVAMDYTGRHTRVVEDPTEAFAISVVEEREWRKKSPIASSRLASSPTTRAKGMAAGVHTAEPWFFGGISRHQSVELLTTQGLVDGLFLVRDSHTIPGAYVMSLAHNQKVKHLHITSVKHNDTVFYTVDNGSTKFHDLIQLIEFYQANQGCLPTKLTHHVTVLL